MFGIENEVYFKSIEIEGIRIKGDYRKIKNTNY